MDFYNLGIIEALVKLGFSKEALERWQMTDAEREAAIRQDVIRAQTDFTRKKALQAAQEEADLMTSARAYTTGVKPRATPPPIPAEAIHRATPPPLPLEVRGTRPDIPSALTPRGSGQTVSAPHITDRWAAMAGQPTSASFVDPALAATRIGPAPTALSAPAAQIGEQSAAKLPSFLKRVLKVRA